ncbi:MarR family winged helix-turn-helix transcriptional regulator [Lysinimonas soli]|uniref:MarR family winged helix-turn-helix transcriptional regulator n=1 Tax=Lysinimonas soli TaxID=1074233 RepID=A0ABW0NRP4_9MICO
MDEQSGLGEELRAAIGELVRATRVEDALPANQAAALGLLERDGPKTTAQLAEGCRIRHQSMTAIVQHLAARGEVGSSRHPEDGRAQLVTLTEAGRRAVARDRQNRAARLDDVIATRLSDDEKEQLRRAIPLISRLASVGTEPKRSRA